LQRPVRRQGKRAFEEERGEKNAGERREGEHTGKSSREAGFRECLFRNEAERSAICGEWMKSDTYNTEGRKGVAGEGRPLKMRRGGHQRTKPDNVRT